MRLEHLRSELLLVAKCLFFLLCNRTGVPVTAAAPICAALRVMAAPLAGVSASGGAAQLHACDCIFCGLIFALSAGGYTTAGNAGATWLLEVRQAIGEWPCDVQPSLVPSAEAEMMPCPLEGFAHGNARPIRAHFHEETDGVLTIVQQRSSVLKQQMSGVIRRRRASHERTPNEGPHTHSSFSCRCPSQPSAPVLRNITPLLRPPSYSPRGCSSNLIPRPPYKGLALTCSLLELEAMTPPTPPLALSASTALPTFGFLASVAARLGDHERLSGLHKASEAEALLQIPSPRPEIMPQCQHALRTSLPLLQFHAERSPLPTDVI